MKTQGKRKTPVTNSIKFIAFLRCEIINSLQANHKDHYKSSKNITAEDFFIIKWNKP